MGESSAIFDKSVEKLNEATAQNLDRITSNTHNITALKAASFKYECRRGWAGDNCELDVKGKQHLALQSLKS